MRKRGGLTSRMQEDRDGIAAGYSVHCHRIWLRRLILEGIIPCHRTSALCTPQIDIVQIFLCSSYKNITSPPFPFHPMSPRSTLSHSRNVPSPYSRCTSSQPKSSRQQFSACGACRMRRLVIPLFLPPSLLILLQSAL